MKLLPNIITDTNFSKIHNVKLYYVARMPSAIMISYIVSLNSSPFLYRGQWQLTATLHSHKWHGTGHYVQQRIIYFIHSGYLLNNIHLYTNMYIYIEREGLYLYANQQNNNNYFSTSTAGVKCTKTNNITCDFFSFSWAGNIFCGAVEQVCHSVCYPCCRTCKHRALSLHLRTHEASSSCLTWRCVRSCSRFNVLVAARCPCLLGRPEQWWAMSIVQCFQPEGHLYSSSWW